MKFPIRQTSSHIGRRFTSSVTKDLSNDPWNSIISPCTVEPITPGILSGSSYICKDNIVTKNSYTTAASKSLIDYNSPFDATVVKILLTNGLKLIGKSNLDEFGMGSSNTNSHFGPALNPMYSTESGQSHIPGGSSGGSAAAVAAGLASFALGTDTGGSVRLPASYCGVVGFKPTYGRISRWGVIPYAQTLDTIGIISKEVNVITKVFGVLDVYDSKDPTSLPQPVRDSIIHTIKEKLVIGIPQEFVIEELSPEIRNAWATTLSKLVELGHTLKSISIKGIKTALPAYYTLATAEASSNLSRYDGVRYGYSSGTLSEFIASNRTESLGQEVQRRIILGNYTLSSDSGDHYLQATKVREELVQEFSNVFNNGHALFEKRPVTVKDGCDLIISPTSIGIAPKIDDFLKDDKSNFLNSYVNDILTVPASLAGIPALSLPCGGVGIQLMAQFGDDHLVLNVASQILKEKYI